MSHRYGSDANYTAEMEAAKLKRRIEMTTSSIGDIFGSGHALGNLAQNCANQTSDPRTSEQVLVDMIRADLGVVIDPQAWRMFIRHRFERISPLAHRIHDGKR